MRVLVCGVGKVTRHLLKRLSESWLVTVVDKSEERLSRLVQESMVLERALAGDCSSPVILDEVGVGDFDYVLALTDNDKVNLATVRYSREQGVNHVLALVNEQENQPTFREAEARTVLGSSLLAENIYHYLQDPRIKVTPLTLGHAEIMEVDVTQHYQMVGKKVATLINDDWKLVAIFRQDRLLFPRPETVVAVGDRLVIIGSPGIFKPVCDLLECGRPHFPLAYGPGLLLVLASGSDHVKIIRESLHLAQNTKVKHMTVLCRPEDDDAREELKLWSQSMDIRLEEVSDDMFQRIASINTEEVYGLVVIDPFKSPFFKLLSKPVLISLAHSLPSPLLIARHTQPYEQILVPFNATPTSELALEVAVDVAKQLDAEIAVAVVEEPQFIRGGEEAEWVDSVLKRVREMAHIHKFDLKEIVRKGNPVKEIVELAGDYNLMVMGSTTKEKALFYPHVGELLAREAPCSVLIVTR